MRAYADNGGSSSRTANPTVIAFVLVASAYAFYGASSPQYVYAEDVLNSFPALELLAWILADPYLLLALLLVWVVAWGEKVAAMLDPVWLVRGGSLRRILRNVVLPQALRSATTVWSLVYVIAFLVMIGTWLVSGQDAPHVGFKVTVVLVSQLFRGILFFVLATCLLFLVGASVPAQVRQLSIWVFGVALWLSLFLFLSLPASLPTFLRPIGLISATSEPFSFGAQIASPAQLMLGLLVLYCVICAIDGLRARLLQGRRVTFPSGSARVTVTATLVAILCYRGSGVLDDALSGYRGSLLGVVVEATATLGPAFLAWIAFEEARGRGWGEAIALRTGSRVGALSYHLKRSSSALLRGWLAVVGGAILGIGVSGANGHAVRILAFATAGGLLQALIYLVILLGVAFFVAHRWPAILMIVVLVTVPPPGTRVTWLPVHAAFDSALAAQGGTGPFVNLAVVGFGLLVALIGVVSVAAWQDHMSGRITRESR